MSVRFERVSYPFVLSLCTSFAYVDFVNPDAKTIAITFSEKNLDGRRLLIKDGLC